MRLDNNIADLICLLEYKIAWKAYNDNSYNGWTGESGCGFRYPVHYCRDHKAKEKGEYSRTKALIRGLDPECIHTLYYTFGSNDLSIGNGLIEILEYLEEYYGIDFNKLERRRIKKRQSICAMRQKKLEEGKTIVIKPVEATIGIDIPAGNYIVTKSNEAKYTFLTITDPLDKHIEKQFFEGKTMDIAFVDEQVVSFTGRYPYRLRKSK